jgi:predicted phosphodiesterase
MDIRTSDLLASLRVVDLGRINEPLLVCGGAYSNLEALTALLDTANQLHIPARRIVHTGDGVAYCADPVDTAERLRSSGVHSIQGNVEESLAASLPDCGCGFELGTVCEKLAAQWFSFTDARIGDDLRRWMAGLPHHLTFEMCGLKFRVVHGSVTSINRFMFASQPDADFEAELSAARADAVIAGHSGIPFNRTVGGRLWHNSGPLGLPANDGTPRVWFSILAPGPGGIRISVHALDYDFEAARDKMLRENVCPEYARALETGLWPSLDILPEAERRVAGVPLTCEEMLVAQKDGVSAPAS